MTNNIMLAFQESRRWLRGSCRAGLWRCLCRHLPEATNVGTIKVFDTNRKLCDRFVENSHLDGCYGSFEDIRNDRDCDAVHLVTPIPLHAQQSVAVLDAGKHCDCTVPMATSLSDIQRITDARRRSGKNYMMMETTLYTYQYFSAEI